MGRGNGIRLGAIIGLVLGILLVIASYYISITQINPYLIEIHSEMFGAGIILAILGGAYLLGVSIKG